MSADSGTARTGRPAARASGTATWQTSSSILGLAVAILLSACGERPSGEPSGTQEAPSDSASVPSRDAGSGSTDEAAVFVDRGTESGLDFVQFNGMSGEFFMAEVTGSGGALIDYDRDGDLDIYFVQGTLLGPEVSFADVVFPPVHPLPLTDRLYRNDLDGAGLRFVDVTAEAGLTASRYGMSVATGDYDNDGWVDIYVTNVGSNQLLHNEGGNEEGVVIFADATDEAGVDDRRWSVPSTFLDYDRDGDLDLFVGNYIAADLVNRTRCRDFTGALDYCGPGAFAAEPDRLFRNRGDGTFEDVTEAAGIVAGFGGALGVVAADLDGDGWPDLYVANDSQPNNFWLNQRDGTFVDEALLAGCSVNANGKAEASMGVDVVDFDGDGDLDLFMAHLTSETNTLFRNDGRGIFDDETVATGLGPASRRFTSFGTTWIDYDNDSWPDLIVVSGAVKKIEQLARAGDPFPLHQPNQLFRNLGAATPGASAADGSEVVRFEETTTSAGSAFEVSEVSRAAIRGDVDNDGDLDVLVVNNSGPARLLINRLAPRNHWLGLRLLGWEGGRDMLGARVSVERRDGSTLWRWAHSDGSFGSAGDPRVHFGLGENSGVGAAKGVSRVVVTWPDGASEQWTDLPIDSYSTLIKGSGRPSPASAEPAAD